MPVDAKFVRVPTVVESPGHCGPASLLSVAKHHGIESTEKHLALQAHTDSKGTTPQAVARVARQLGLRAQHRTGATVADLRKQLEHGDPPIVNWWSTDDGHYSVVEGVDGKNVRLMDPEGGKHKVIDRETFGRNWFDIDRKGKLLRHGMIEVKMNSNEVAAFKTAMAKLAEGEEEQPGFVRRHAKLLAGLGAAAVAAPAAYAMLRRKQLSDNPALRAIQEAAEKGYVRTVGDKAPKGWLAKLKNRVMHDADQLVYAPITKKAPLAPTQYPGVVMHTDPSEAAHIVGAVNPVAQHKDLINRIGSNKWEEYQFFNQHAPGSMARTENMGDVLKTLGYPSVPTDPAERTKMLSVMQEHFKKNYPRGFVMKDIAGLQSGGSFPQEHHNLNDLYQGYLKKGIDKKLKEIDTLYDAGKISPDKATEMFQKIRSNHDEFSGRVLGGLMEDPRSAIIQEKFQIEKPHAISRVLNPVLGDPETREIRVHVIGGKAVPDLSSGRFDSTMELLDRKPLHDAAAYAQGIVDKLPAEHRSANFAMDVAPLQGGGHRLIESNPGGDSGFLMPDMHPLNSFRLHKAITGRWSPTVSGAGAAAAGVGAGALGAGAAHLAIRPAAGPAPGQQAPAVPQVPAAPPVPAVPKPPIVKAAAAGSKPVNVSSVAQPPRLPNAFHPGSPQVDAMGPPPKATLAPPKVPGLKAVSMPTSKAGDMIPKVTSVAKAMKKTGAGEGTGTAGYQDVGVEFPEHEFHHRPLSMNQMVRAGRATGMSVRNPLAALLLSGMLNQPKVAAVQAVVAYLDQLNREV